MFVLAACDGPREPSIDLADPAAWKLTRDEWIRVVTDPFRATYDDYARMFDAALPDLRSQIGAARSDGDIQLATRPHYAGDPELTRGQARARWALPVQAPARVAVLDGAPLDVVFVLVGDRRDYDYYKAIVGIDAIVVDKTRAMDAGCAVYLETLGSKMCQTVGWEVADAALRADKPRLAHACSLAMGQCTR